MAEHRITTPISDDVIETLRAGDTVFITGYLYTGRDSAHKKLIDLINEGKDLPIEVKGQLIYYVGPTPARPGKPIGSAGPTTSYRMDSFAPILHRLGIKGTIGKGSRNEEVKESLKKYKAVYLAAVGGGWRSDLKEHRRGRSDCLSRAGSRSHKTCQGQRISLHRD